MTFPQPAFVISPASAFKNASASPSPPSLIARQLAAVGVALGLLWPGNAVQAQTPTSPLTASADRADNASVASAMRSAASALLAATAPADQPRLALAFDDALRADWHYTPRSRAGLAIKDMSPEQRSAASALLAAPLSAPGLATVQDVMALEGVLRELESGSSLRVPENYAIALYGPPTPNDAWGWRIEGHHLSLHFTVQAGRVVSTLPQFLGANPARVPAGLSAPLGALAGRRVLAAPEDAARQLLASLDASQRAQAVISLQTYGDLVSRNAARASPLEKTGLGYLALRADQQAALMALVTQFAAPLKPALAAERMARVQSGGLDSLQFAWVGSSALGQGHYFRVQGARFLLEYDNSGGNHVHSVWRDFDGDWGRDVLADHYRRARKP